MMYLRSTSFLIMMKMYFFCAKMDDGEMLAHSLRTDFCSIAYHDRVIEVSITYFIFIEHFCS